MGVGGGRRGTKVLCFSRSHTTVRMRYILLECFCHLAPISPSAASSSQVRLSGKRTHVCSLMHMDVTSAERRSSFFLGGMKVRKGVCLRRDVLDVSTAESPGGTSKRLWASAPAARLEVSLTPHASFQTQGKNRRGGGVVAVVDSHLTSRRLLVCTSPQRVDTSRRSKCQRSSKCLQR